MTYYPGKTLMEEAEYLRAKAEQLTLYFSTKDAKEAYSLLPEWNANTDYKQYQSVRYNNKLYMKYSAATDRNPPANNLDNWFEIGNNEWPTWTSGTTCNAGDKFYYSSSDYVSKADNNTDTPSTSSAKWGLIRGSRWESCKPFTF